MLALLSAPRGRVSAARIVARLRERERAEAHRVVIRLPHAPAGVTPDREARPRPARRER